MPIKDKRNARALTEYLRNSKYTYLRYSKRKGVKMNLTTGQYVSATKVLKRRGIITRIDTSRPALYKVNRELLEM